MLVLRYFAILLTTSLLGIVAVPTTVLAQDTLELDEIVVTARRAAENLQDVPLAITAFNAEQLEQAAIDDLNDVAAFTPGLTFSNLIGEFLPVPVIRGVAPTDIFGENNAAIFVDGIYVSGRAGLNFSQLDIERIEVVKGPQSAMYGRSSFSGAINVVTKRPGNDVAGRFELIGGDGGRRKASASIGGPIVRDRLFGRLALLSDSWDGSYENTNPGGGPDIGGYEFKTLQTSLLWTPSDSFDAQFSFYLSDDLIDVSAMTGVAANCEDAADLGSPFSRPQNFCGELPPADDNGLAAIEEDQGEDRELTRSSLSLSWDLPAGLFSSLTGYSKLEQSSLLDGSRGVGDQLPWIYVDTAGALSSFESGVLRVDAGAEIEELSQELRWTSPSSQTTRFSLGAYLYSVDSKTFNPTLIANQPLPADFAGFCPCVEAPVPFPPFTLNIPIGTDAYLPWFLPGGSAGASAGALISDNETDAWALFGYVERDLTDKVTGRLELRYSDEEKSFIAPLASLSDSASWDALTVRATLDTKFNEDWLLYVSAAKGSKSGDFETVTDTVNNVTLVTTFDPEENWTYELGTKGTLADGRVRTDVAVYFIDWRDIVIPQIFESIDGQMLGLPTAVNTNAGDASVFGIEASLNAIIGQHVNLDVGVSWTDATMDDATLASLAGFPSFAPDGDVSGNTILRQSEWQANASLSYRRPLRADWDFYTRADLLYQGEQFVGLDSQAVVPAKTTANLRIGFNFGNFGVEAWAENLFDDDTPVSSFRDVFFNNTPDGVASDPGDFFAWRLSTLHPRRRAMGLTARYRF